MLMIKIYFISGQIMEPVSRFKRYIASIIDNIISGIIMFIVAFCYGITLLLGDYIVDPDKLGQDPLYLVPATIICLVIGMIYFALFESSKYSATHGKMLFKMQVVKKEGNKITFVQSCYRYCVLILPMFFYAFLDVLPLKILFSGVTILLLLVWYLPVYFTKDRNCLHDIITGTRVVKKVIKNKR